MVIENVDFIEINAYFVLFFSISRGNIKSFTDIQDSDAAIENRGGSSPSFKRWSCLFS